jgi:tetratricopeptide (TPR) repeat protein
MNDLPQESAAQPSVDRGRLERLLAFLQHDPGNLKLRKDAIREACNALQWPIAHELLDAGLQAHPEDAELLAQAGLVHLHHERYEDAEHVLTAALAQGLEPAEVRYNLAFTLFMLRRPEEALQHLLPPLMVFELPRTLILRARCLHYLNRRDEAIVDCRALLAQDTADAEANGLLALLLYERDERDTARRHLDSALRRDPTQCEALLTLASLQFDAEQEALARASFERLLGAHPNCGRAWLGLALIELGRTQIKAAKRDILLALKYMPDHIGTWHVLAWTEIMLGNVADAEGAFQQALAIDRNFGETHGGLAVVAAMRGDVDEARLAVKRALRLDHDSLSARYAEMILLEGAGEKTAARATLEQVLARPAARGELTYRDLVVRQMMRIRTQSTSTPTHH